MNDFEALADHLTPELLVAVLRARPARAEAMMNALYANLKIAEPRWPERRGSKLSYRFAVTGEQVGIVHGSGADRVGIGPNNEKIYPSPRETIGAFKARVDALWRDDGWIFLEKGP